MSALVFGVPRERVDADKGCWVEDAVKWRGVMAAGGEGFRGAERSIYANPSMHFRVRRSAEKREEGEVKVPDEQGGDVLIWSHVVVGSYSSGSTELRAWRLQGSCSRSLALASTVLMAKAPISLSARIANITLPEWPHSKRVMLLGMVWGRSKFMGLTCRPTRTALYHLYLILTR